MKNNIIEGEGCVEIKSKGICITSDYVELNRITSEALIWGNVVFEEGDSYINCELMELNLRTKLGTLYDGRGFIAPTYYFSGEEIELLDHNTIKLTNGIYTACDQSPPDWKIKLGKGTIKTEDYAYLKDASLWAKNVPVFYSPYLIVPAKTKRATGLLTPEIGYSDNKGAFMKNKFYWNIAEWTDSTISMDYFTESGVGTGLEYRYAITEESKGEIDTYYIKDQNTSDERWKAKGGLRNDFSHNILGVANLDAVSDKSYNQDYEGNLAIT